MKSGRQIVPALLLALACGLPQITWAMSDSSHDFDATRNRPLFAPTRRPPAKPVVELVDPAPTAVVDTAPAVEVRGVIFGGKHPIAIIKRPLSPRMVDVAVGSDVEGWIVDAIQRRGIVLRRDNRTITLSMPEPGR